MLLSVAEPVFAIRMQYSMIAPGIALGLVVPLTGSEITVLTLVTAMLATAFAHRDVVQRDALLTRIGWSIAVVAVSDEDRIDRASECHHHVAVRLIVARHRIAISGIAVNKIGSTIRQGRRHRHAAERAGHSYLVGKLVSVEINVENRELEPVDSGAESLTHNYPV